MLTGRGPCPQTTAADGRSSSLASHTFSPHQTDVVAEHPTLRPKGCSYLRESRVVGRSASRGGAGNDGVVSRCAVRCGAAGVWM